MFRKIGMLSLCTVLTSCSYFNLNNNTTNTHDARCKEIKHRIIFNSTSSGNIAEQSAELDRLNQSYRDEGCS